MKNTHLGLLFVSMCSALALVHGCAGELDNPSSFIDASFFPGTGGSGAGGAGGSGAGGSGAGMGGSGGSGMVNCPDMPMFLKTTCGISTCHGPPVQVGLDLSNVGTGQQYIGMQPTGACAGHPFIDSSNAQNSLLYLILQNTRPCGLQMPFLQSPLSQTQQACVLQWIQGVLGGGGGGGGASDAGPDASSGAGGSTGTGGSMGTGGRSTGAGGTNGAAGR